MVLALPVLFPAALDGAVRGGYAVSGGRGGYGVPGQNQECTCLEGLGPCGVGVGQEPRVWALWCQWRGNRPQAARIGVQHTSSVSPGSWRSQASRQGRALCLQASHLPLSSSWSPPQDQRSLLQFKGKESFLSLGLCLLLGQSGVWGGPLV